MNLPESYQKLVCRNRLLAYLGLAHIILYVVLLALFFIDSRTVMGINTWSP